ncbi:MAG: ribosomal-processing cysteine protease Prp [Clostridia bacterium]|nr:ribosomal-processing cysteine protease Prp [Clostridia bacterium]
MTSVKFLADKKLCGFEISGHSTVNCDDEVGKTVCAAVSSAAYMTANTITEIIGDNADARVSDGEMYFKVLNPSDAAIMVLEGFKLHLTELSMQYSNNIKILEVQKNVKD